MKLNFLYLHGKHFAEWVISHWIPSFSSCLLYYANKCDRDSMHLALYCVGFSKLALHSDTSALVRTVEAAVFCLVHLSFSHVGNDKCKSVGIIKLASDLHTRQMDDGRRGKWSPLYPQYVLMCGVCACVCIYICVYVQACTYMCSCAHSWVYMWKPEVYFGSLLFYSLCFLRQVFIESGALC